MPNNTSNVVLYATRAGRYPVSLIANGAAANTVTTLITADAAGTVVSDILFRSKDASPRNFEIIIGATGQEAVPQNARVMVQIGGGSGDNGTTAIASLAAMVPTLFDIDLAGNRVFLLEAGQSISIKNTAALAGAFHVTVKARDY